MMKVVLTLCSTIILAWYLLQPEEQVAKESSAKNAFIASNIDLIKTQGSIIERIQATRLSQEHEHAPIMLTEPSLIQTESGINRLTLSAQEGQNKSNLLTLKKDVHAIHSPLGKAPVNLKTEVLDYDSAKKIASTDAFIKAYETNHIQTATGMTLNLVTDTMELKKNVKGYFKHSE